jgi:hypothetical protein
MLVIRKPLRKHCAGHLDDRAFSISNDVREGIVVRTHTSSLHPEHGQAARMPAISGRKR